ncbi:MAG: YggS family pyridoxal phosphate-dependent enzyme [Caulobacteraceae bacterium]
MPCACPDPTDVRAAIVGRIAAAARAAGRDPASVGLTAVCKQQAWTAIAPILAAGQRVFGENRVQEAVERWRDHRAGLELRLVGPLQTNKARAALALFDVIETLDGAKLAAKLAREGQRLGRVPRLFVQVNTGAEPQKRGVRPEETDAFVALCRRDFGLEPEGLMCLPPHGEAAAPHFALLAQLASRNGLGGLSMGMSADFETAIRFGATSVRIGSALFGARVGDTDHLSRSTR